MALDKASTRLLILTPDRVALDEQVTSIRFQQPDGWQGILALLDDDSLGVSWVSRPPSGDNLLNLRHVPVRGEPGPVLEVAPIHQLRVVPQLGYQDGNLLLVWTDENEASRHLEAVRVPVSIH